MRFKSANTDGYQIFAVTGVNTISFAIEFVGADVAGLLGFAVERIDPTENERYFMAGFKVFESVIPHPDESTAVTTFEHPVQSFVWDDFTGKEGREYTYLFHPLKGEPRNLDRSATPIEIKIKTETLFDDTATHQVFFNRGAASSQAYSRKFGNKKPDDQETPEKRAEAFEWLSRKLDDAILKFIGNAQPGDTLLCCFYEFRHEPVARALKNALDLGVKVRIIMDAKVNEHTDSKGVFHESFPREDNLRMVGRVQLPDTAIVQRVARTSAISHNKFMVLLKGAAELATEVWTGSTNISDGGVFGQTNVGHWLRDAAVAAKFEEYWKVLEQDPGGMEGDDSTTVRRKNRELREAVEGVMPPPTDRTALPVGVTPVFSPHSNKDVLPMYAGMVDQASDLACITLAFGISKEFKEQLKDNTAASHISFFLLEKKDVPNPRSTQPFIAINASNNVYKAWGSYLKDPVRQWTRETNNRILGFNTHVAYIHSKFLLMDPLGDEPITVCGSANFSDDSQNENDENMLIIRGDPRVADIYFTEFNRLFNHYYFRSVVESTSAHPPAAAHPPADNKEASLFLDEGDDPAFSWMDKYKPGRFRRKRVEMFTRMTGFTNL